jgi:hypothetical protein
MEKLQVKETMEQGREDLVYLPIGVKYEGQVIRLVQIKEPDGFTEELQSSDSFRKHLSTVVNATLADCIVNIHDFDLPQNRDKALDKKVEIVKQLSEPDRQYLMSRIYQLEHGNTLKASLVCTHCGQSSEVEINLNEDFSINYLNEDTVDKANDDRMIIKNVELTHPITFNGNKYDVINVRMPNGATSLSLEKSDNMGAVVTKMILQMVACNLDKFTPNETDIKRWSKKVRHGLINDVGERRVGFINSVSYSCEKCGKNSKSPVQVTNFLGN